MSTGYRIACVPGDGIGVDVVAEARKVLDAAVAARGSSLEWTDFDWSCERYARTGTMMPEDGIEQLAGFDAIFLGAVGFPGVPDHVSLWGLLIPVRRAFAQYVNLRPVRLLPGTSSVLAGRSAGELEMVIVRENCEGEYSTIGGRHEKGRPGEFVLQESVFTRVGVERIVRYAFDLARTRSRRVCSATKSNGIIHTMPFWDEIFAEVAAGYPDVASEQCHIDALAARMVERPDRLDVVVGSNLFGDILSDLAAAVTGGLGMAPSGNINPSGEYPSMFEPVHGSAPDIAGKGIANPVAQILAGAMMLEHLGETVAAAAVTAAVETVLAEGAVATPDLRVSRGARSPGGKPPDPLGKATTTELGDAIAAAVRG